MTDEEILNKCISDDRGGQAFSWDSCIKAMQAARADERKKMESSPAHALTEDRACPCLYLETPCHENCTCKKPYSSTGCHYCCTYGSEEQRKEKAKRLSLLLSNSREGKDGEGKYSEEENLILLRKRLMTIQELHECAYETKDLNGVLKRLREVYPLIEFLPPLPSAPKTQKP